MKIPETTEENPYIEFSFDKKRKLNLKATSTWWGGKQSGFCSSDGSEGNTCPPKELKSYIKAFKTRKITAIEKEIKILTSRLEQIKTEFKNYESL